jgi:hypothetical protein
MLDIRNLRRTRNCAGVSRRDLLRVGALTVGGLGMGDLLRYRAMAGDDAAPRRSVICFWLDGGPTHIDTYDPKPTAPAEFRGPFGVASTKVSGVHVCDQFPRHGSVMDRISLVRSMHHNNGDHFAAAHWMWTGYHGSNAANRDPMYPSVGAVASRMNGPNRPGMPAFVAIPQAMTVGIRPGYQSGTFLGVASNPFDVASDPNRDNFQVQNLNLPGGIDAARVDDRQGLLDGLDRVQRDVDRSGLMHGMDEFNQEAFSLITSAAARKAFDISAESDALRDRYGRNTVGQSALLARRLVEAGVTFVTVHSGGWDNHGNIERAIRDRHAPQIDAAVPTLIEDLDQRGLLQDVIVMVMGEFGRTPKVNGGAGRDHWGNAMSVLLAGGGLRGGHVIGATDDKGQAPVDQPVKPAHVLHTIYHQLGIDPTVTHVNHAGRPIPILNDGAVIRDLV